MGDEHAQQHRAEASRHEQAADLLAEAAFWFRSAGAVQKAEAREREARIEREAAEFHLHSANRLDLDQ